MGGARRFSVSTPDWGQAHLSLDAIVAYVDDELAAVPHAGPRSIWPAVTSAPRRSWRSARPDRPCAPRTCRACRRRCCALQAIPVDAELPPPPPGLSVTPDGQFVLLRDVPSDDGGDAGRSSRHGAAALRRADRRAVRSGHRRAGRRRPRRPRRVGPSPGEGPRGSVPQSVPARAVLGPVLDISVGCCCGAGRPGGAGRPAAPSDPPGAHRLVAPEATPVLVVESVWRDAAVR